MGAGFAGQGGVSTIARSSALHGWQARVMQINEDISARATYLVEE